MGMGTGNGCGYRVQKNQEEPGRTRKGRQEPCFTKKVRNVP